MPVTSAVATLTSVILPSGLMVTSGSRIRLEQASRVLGSLFLGGDVASGCEDTQNVARRVLVHGGVVQDVRQRSVDMPDRQGEVGDEAVCGYPPIPLASLSRCGEVVGEVGADELSRSMPVTRAVAALTSVILPSGLMVTSGSRVASSRLREYSAACFSAVTSRAVQ